MEEKTVCLNIDMDDLGFIKSAIALRAVYLIEYINDCESDHKLFLEEQQEEEEAQLDLLRKQNEKLQERLAKMEENKLNPFALTPERIREMKDAGFWTRQPEKEIQDIEIDQFQAELREMIEKHKPTKRGRPVGSKNKEKIDAK
jgi:multidrug resistance efflux pump